jgi:hypothetical protein
MGIKAILIRLLMARAFSFLFRQVWLLPRLLLPQIEFAFL